MFTTQKDVAGITDMKVLAEMIGDLHYETFADLLLHLKRKVVEDSEKDRNDGRTTLADTLETAGGLLYTSHQFIIKAWQISKPFMEDKNKKLTK